MRSVRLLLACALTAGLLWGPPASAAYPCDGLPPERQMLDDGILHTEDLHLPSGRYALPSRPEPTQLVVMMHGHGNNSCSWRNHLRSVSARGAIAVAMDFSSQDPVTNRGWWVLSGAEDSITAAKHFLSAYPSLTDVFILSPSMGANAAGMAIAHPDAVRADGSPLFDHWVATEGVHNFTELYAIAFALRGVNASAARFVEDAEEAAGGTPSQSPQAYAHLTNVARAHEMSYLKSAILVHGLDDGTVPYGQSREMALALRGVGVRTKLLTVVGRGSGEPGTTFSSNAGGAAWAAAGQGRYPTAGHGWEGSDTHLVIRKGFDQLFALMDGRPVPEYGESVVPGLPS